MKKKAIHFMTETSNMTFFTINNNAKSETRKFPQSSSCYG